MTTLLQRISTNLKAVREELIKKLKHRFIEQFQIDTSAVFTGNRIYILMFDLKQPNGTPNRTSRRSPSIHS